MAKFDEDDMERTTLPTQDELTRCILDIRITSTCIREYLLFGKRDLELPLLTPGEFEDMGNTLFLLKGLLQWIEHQN